jgi:hypothetical protein
MRRDSSSGPTPNATSLVIGLPTGAPRLTPEIVAPLPDINGHDMMPVPDSPHLILATAAHTWLFNRDTHQFAKHPRLGDAAKVKSVHVDPDTTITLPGEKVYKVRWINAGG